MALPERGDVLPRRVAGKITAVATWRGFESSAPGVAAMACLLWPGITALHRGELTKPAGSWFSIAYLATSRPDGSPRLHPFCPVLAGGRLFAAIPGNSPKGHDLRRDPRCAIHALPGPDDDELSIRARAKEVGQDPAARASVIAVVTPTGGGRHDRDGVEGSDLRVRHPAGRCRQVARHRAAGHPGGAANLESPLTRSPATGQPCLMPRKWRPRCAHRTNLRPRLDRRDGLSDAESGG